jgi:hypothetical protein
MHTLFWWGNLREREHLEKPRRRWENNIKMDLREVEWERGLNRSSSGWRQVAGYCECGNESSDSIKCEDY